MFEWIFKNYYLENNDIIFILCAIIILLLIIMTGILVAKELRQSKC